MRNWEEHYKTGDTPWDKGEPSPGLVDYLSARPFTGRILVPGCGYGHDARAIAEAGGPGASVLGIDTAPTAVQGANARNTLPNCEFEVADFLALPAAWKLAFDALFEHTLFCAIDPEQRGAYAVAAADCLRSGGIFLAVFYREPECSEGPPFGCTTAELDALFSRSFQLIEEWIPGRAYAERENRELMRLYLKR
jgi:SAM-dependent methyltransferase